MENQREYLNWAEAAIVLGCSLRDLLRRFPEIENVRMNGIGLLCREDIEKLAKKDQNERTAKD